MDERGLVFVEQHSIETAVYGIGCIHGDACQAAAIRKRIFLDGGDEVGDHYVRQKAAGKERPGAYVGDAAWNHIVSHFAPRTLNEHGLVFVEQYPIETAVGGVGCIHVNAGQAAAVPERGVTYADGILSDRDARCARAVLKRIVSDSDDTFGYSDVFKVPATIECRFTDDGDAVAYCDTIQAAAPVECPISYLRDISADSSAYQTPAVLKRMVLDVDDTVGNRYARKILAPVERIFSYVSDDAGNRIAAISASRTLNEYRPVFGEQYSIDTAVGEVGCIHGDACQAAAVGEGLFPDTDDAGGNRNTREAGVFEESLLPNGCNGKGLNHIGNAHVATGTCVFVDGDFVVYNRVNIILSLQRSGKRQKQQQWQYSRGNGCSHAPPGWRWMPGRCRESQARNVLTRERFQSPFVPHKRCSI